MRHHWTPNDIDTADHLRHNGYPYESIARQLHLSVGAVKSKLRTRKQTVFRTPNVYTSAEAGRIMGVSCNKTVVYWIERGWLKARRSNSIRGSAWRITRANLIAFLHDRRAWMAWRPEQITDAHIREVATSVRAGQGRYISVGDMAARYCVTVQTVNIWIQRGHLSTVKYGNHWIWEPDLDHWTIPNERPKQRRGTANTRACARLKHYPTEEDAWRYARQYQHRCNRAAVPVWCDEHHTYHVRRQENRA